MEGLEMSQTQRRELPMNLHDRHRSAFFQLRVVMSEKQMHRKIMVAASVSGFERERRRVVKCQTAVLTSGILMILVISVILAILVKRVSVFSPEISVSIYLLESPTTQIQLTQQTQSIPPTQKDSSRYKNLNKESLAGKGCEYQLVIEEENT